MQIHKTDARRLKIAQLKKEAKGRYGPRSFYGRDEFCRECAKMVRTIRGPVPHCSKCGGKTDAVA